MKNESPILLAAKPYLKDLHNQSDRSRCLYHTWDRTEHLVETAEKIGSESGLDDEALESVLLASLFLYSSAWTNTELDASISVKNLKSFLKSQEGDYALDKLEQLIHSVFSDSEDKSLNEEVLYDAHFSFFGEKKLKQKLELKAMEEDLEVSLLNQHRKNIEFIADHRFRTTYAIETFEKRKAKNIRKLQATIDKKVSKVKKRKRKSRKLGRGIETMYRSIYRNHINLSSIADAKANLIIRVNTIIMSIIITLGGTGYTFFETGFFKYARFTIPVIILLLGSLAAVIFAVLSARPKVTKNKVSKKKLLGNESSILFFGNFIGMEKDDFIREMSLFRQNDQRVYDSMTVDLYYLGLVLDKKYHLVKISYNLFILGLALSVISFIGIFSYSQFNIGA